MRPILYHLKWLAYYLGLYAKNGFIRLCVAIHDNGWLVGGLIVASASITMYQGGHYKTAALTALVTMGYITMWGYQRTRNTEEPPTSPPRDSNSDDPPTYTSSTYGP